LHRLRIELDAGIIWIAEPAEQHTQISRLSSIYRYLNSTALSYPTQLMEKIFLEEIRE